jgi:hypothetical protein
LLFLARFPEISEALLELLGVGQLGGTAEQFGLPVLLADDLHLFGGEEDVGHVEGVQDVALFNGLALLEHSVDDGHGGGEELLVLVGGEDADDGEGVL